MKRPLNISENKLYNYIICRCTDKGRNLLKENNNCNRNNNGSPKDYKITANGGGRLWRAARK